MKNCFISACLDIEMPVPCPLLCPQDLAVGCFTVLLQARISTSSSVMHHKVFAAQLQMAQSETLVGIPVYRRTTTPKH